MNTTRSSGRGQRQAASRPPERDKIRHGGVEIPFVVVRSAQRHRTLSMGVKDGVVRILCPVETPKAHIREAVASRAEWLLERLEVAVPKTGRLLEAGDIIPFRGTSLPLVFVSAPGDVMGAKIGDTEMLVTTPADLDPEYRDEVLRSLLRDMLQRITEHLVHQMIAKHAPVVGKSPTRVFVREQKTRWGSCATDGSLRFNWRLSMLPDSETEYVVVHELCHLLQQNHSAQFWAEVARVLPGRGNGPKRVQGSVAGLPL